MSLALRLSARNRIDGTAFDLVEERLPVLIGRDGTVATVVLDANLKVSRVHASLELRGDEIYVRDARSVNGTVVDGQTIPTDTWILLGRGSEAREFSIADWSFQVSAVQAPQAVNVTNTSFGADQGHRVLGLHETMASHELSAGGVLSRTTPAPFAPDRVGQAYDRYHQASKELYELIVAELEAMSPPERRAAASVIARRHSMLGDDPAFAQLLRNYGADIAPVGSSPPTGSTAQPTFTPAPAPVPPALSPQAGRPLVTPEAVALKAVQYLSLWYVDRSAVTASEIVAFTDKLRGTLDELMRGHVPLLAGLDRFEQQMAMQDEEGHFELPRTPVSFARALLDWNDTSQRPVRALRRSFADLMMHQVGMLNGIMRGVSVLLTELSPSTIDKAWQMRNGRRGAIGRFFGRRNKEREMLAILAERHSDLADEENETFRLLFGPEFQREYKLLAQEQSSSMRGQDLGASLYGAGAGASGPKLPSKPPPGFDGSRTQLFKRQ